MLAGLWTTGCYVDVVDGEGVYLADLEVNWRIQGSQSVTHCDTFGIERWEVSLRGWESRDLLVDCRAHWWSSENDLLALHEGTYTVTVRAVDAGDYVLATESTQLDLIDQGYLDTLTFEFYPEDFSY